MPKFPSSTVYEDIINNHNDWIELQFRANTVVPLYIIYDIVRVPQILCWQRLWGTQNFLQGCSQIYI